jgi:hypothetical protein
MLNESGLASFQPVKSLPLKSGMNPFSTAGVCMTRARRTGAA